MVGCPALVWFNAQGDITVCIFRRTTNFTRLLPNAPHPIPHPLSEYRGKIVAFGRNHGIWRRGLSDFVDETQKNSDRFREMCVSLEIWVIRLSKLERNSDDEESLNIFIHAMSLAYEVAKVMLDSPTDCATRLSRINTEHSQRTFCCFRFPVH